MTAHYYDVTILGADLCGLLCASLLTKQGYRTLVLGQGEAPSTYKTSGNITLPRYPFALHGDDSTTTRRVLETLGIRNHVLYDGKSTVRQATQFCTPSSRIELSPNHDELQLELHREAPKDEAAALQLFKRSNTVHKALGDLVSTTGAWPPESFLERRKWTKSSAELGNLLEEFDLEYLEGFSEDSPIPVLAKSLTSFGSSNDPERNHSIETLLGLYEWRHSLGNAWSLPKLEHELVTQIENGAGSVQMGDRALDFVHQNEEVQGLRLERTQEVIRSGTVVWNRPLHDLLRLLPTHSMQEFGEQWGIPEPCFTRYAMHLTVKEHALGSGLASRSFFVLNPKEALHGSNVLHIERLQANDSEAEVLHVECLLPFGSFPPPRREKQVSTIGKTVQSPVTGKRSNPPASIRKQIIETLERFLPFLRDNILQVDSPHDGLDPYSKTNQCWIPSQEPWSRGAQTMRSIYRYPSRSNLRLCALSSALPLRNLLLGGTQLLPGMGQRGAFLAAWSTAERVHKGDRKARSMRRGSWMVRS